MILINEKIEQFKREIKSITYYEKRILEIEYNIHSTDQMLDCLGDASFYLPIQKEQLIKYGNKIEILLQQDKLINQRAMYLMRIKEIIDLINRIGNHKDQQLIIDLFINNKNYKKLILDYDYNDYSAILKHINSVLKKIL